MIDFAKITKTLDGYDCHYFGTRESYGTKLHCFGVWTPTGLYEKCYDDQGRHLAFSMGGEWEVSETDAFAIVRPPKIVEVTGWVTLHTKGDGYCIGASMSEPLRLNNYIAKQQHTFRFEVPHD